jgi:hypothetical protein
MKRTRIPAISIAFLFATVACAFAGGPLYVGGPALGNRPAFGVDGQPFLWNPAKMPISYRVDPGPMATNPAGTIVIDHATGLQRLQSMFGVWQSVSTANISFSDAGDLLKAGSYTGGDVTTAAQFNALMGSCQAGTQNPIIFDANGSLMASLGLPPEVIGFDSGCAVDTTTGYLIGSAILLNGQFQDGANSGTNFEITANQFDQAITHEMGHFSGLDHSQINVDLYQGAVFPCDIDELAGMPLMFPVLFCQARKDAAVSVLAPDDIAWISTFYPNAVTPNEYGTISGTIYFGNSVSMYQGANVIARSVDDPSTTEDESRRVAVSVVSGYLFTGNVGQSVTAALGTQDLDNTNGSSSGSRNSSLLGYYKISVPPGTYTVEVENIDQDFTGGSSVGPLDPPAALNFAEFWNQNESAFDFPLQRDTITVHAGDKITGTDIILNDQYPQFDQYEDSGALSDPPMVSPVPDVEVVPA